MSTSKPTKAELQERCNRAELAWNTYESRAVALEAHAKSLEILVMAVADTTEGVLLRDIGDCSWFQTRSAIMKLGRSIPGYIA